jgi:hypothetical protein
MAKSGKQIGGGRKWGMEMGNDGRRCGHKSASGHQSISLSHTIQYPMNYPCFFLALHEMNNDEMEGQMLAAGGYD